MSEWRRVKVKDVCCLIVDCVNRTAPVVDYETHYRMIRTTNIRNGRIDLSNCRYVDETTFKKWTRRAVVNNGDVILTREAPIGEVGYVKDIGCVFLGQRTMQYRADPDKIDSRYLFFAFRSPDLQYQFGSHDGSGSVVSHIRVADCHEFMVPLPPKKEQVAISELLGALDDKIDLNRRMNETLEAMARAIFKDWFVDFGPVRAKAEGRPPYLSPEIWALFPDALDDDDKPVGWCYEPLDEIASFLNGLALQKYPAADSDEFLPVIKIAELRSGITENSDKASLNIPSQYIVRDGDILFSWSGSLTHLVWTHGKGALNQHLFKVSSDRYPKWFFYYWIAQHMPVFRAVAASKATTMGHIQRHHLTEALTVIPNRAVLKIANSIIEPLFERTIANNLENRTLSQTRDLLLPKLMSGEIRLRDAEKMVEAVA